MYKRLPYLTLLLFLTVFAASQPPPQTQDDRYTSGAAQTPQAKTEQDRLTEARKASKFSGVPVVGEFQAQPEPEPDRSRRLVREQRYSASHYHLRVEDPGQLVGGKQEHAALLFIDYVVVGNPVDPRGIPVSNSNAIVVGTVVDGKCFVTKDHTYVYTDYSIKIDQILKNDPAANLAAGNVVIAAREGGAIHFPSGHVTNFLVAGHGLPEIGSEYVLFLWRPIPTFPEYEIIFDSGYQLKNGRVYPLDDVNSQYVGVEAPGFLDEITKAILAASQKGASQ